MVDVSVIIVSWNTKNILRNCLQSIYQHAGKTSYEIIVVDNASRDGSVDMVTTKFPQVILIANNENRGFAAANNQGMAIARGRYILLLNSDTIVLDDAIASAVHFTDAHPDVAVVGCRILNQDKTLQPTCFMFPSILNMVLSASYLNKILPQSRFFGRERMTWWDRTETKEVDVVTGCFMMVRREAIEQIGVMDERFFMYGEETDWCYRFKKRGWKIMFTPSAEIIHLGGQSTQYVRRQMLVQVAISILQFMRKHHNWLTYRLSCLLMTIFFAIRLPVWVFIALIDHERRKQAFDRVKAYSESIGRIMSRSRIL